MPLADTFRHLTIEIIKYIPKKKKTEILQLDFKKEKNNRGNGLCQTKMKMEIAFSFCVCMRFSLWHIENLKYTENCCHSKHYTNYHKTHTVKHKK